MITQLFLDALALLFAAVIDTIPPLPAEVSSAVAGVASGAADLAPAIVALGPVVPFAAINSVLVLFPVAAGFWLSVSAVRFGLWLFDR